MTGEWRRRRDTGPERLRRDRKGSEETPLSATNLLPCFQKLRPKGSGGPKRKGLPLKLGKRETGGSEDCVVGLITGQGRHGRSWTVVSDTETVDKSLSCNCDSVAGNKITCKGVVSMFLTSKTGSKN